MPQSTLEDELEGIQWHIRVLQDRIKNGKGKNRKFQVVDSLVDNTQFLFRWVQSAELTST